MLLGARDKRNYPGGTCLFVRLYEGKNPAG